MMEIVSFLLKRNELYMRGEDEVVVDKDSRHLIEIVLDRSNDAELTRQLLHTSSSDRFLLVYPDVDLNTILTNP